MAFKADENLLELVWKNLPKSPDEKHVTMTDADLEALWFNGFIDTDQFTKNEWLKNFEPHKDTNGNFVLTEEEFLEKDRFRFRGEIFMPFDPLIINEGKYTDEGLQELIDLSVAPSCAFSRSEMKKWLDDFKKKHRFDRTLVTIDLPAKREIAKLIYQNPSPTRRRELLFDAMFIEQMRQIADGTSPLLKATPEQAAQVQMSTFSTLPSSKTEEAAGKLKGVLKTRAKKSAVPEDEGVEIKKVKKSRKGMRG